MSHSDQGLMAEPPSKTVGQGSIVRNRHTGLEQRVEDIDRACGRFRLTHDAAGPAREVGWSAAGLDENWEHVG
jgi:hypothetical protein